MMKKINVLLAFALVAVMGFMTSCGDDEVVGPSISFFGSEFIDADATVAPGATLTFSFLANAGDKDLAKLTVTKDGVNLSGYPVEDIEKDNYKDTIIITADQNEGAYVYAFIIEDKDAETVTKSFTITVEGVVSAGDITTYTAVLIGERNNTTTGSYFSAQDGTVTDADGALANNASIDIVYFYGATNLATLGAPDDNDIAVTLGMTGGMTTKNATRFGASSVTTTSFDAMIDDTDIATIGTLSATKMNQLVVGSVIEFETVAGKKGLIKVTGLVAGAIVTGTISITVKIQE